ncbi:MAG: CBS domain-containing protein [Planctomycetota bacterium]
MKVSKYMTTKLVTASPDLSVKDAFLMMRKNQVRHLPVLEDGKLVGIISDRDLRRPKWVDALDDWTQYYQINDETTVADVMTPNPEVVHTYDRVEKAIKIVREQRYGALPVLNKEEELVGILSAYDLLNALEEFIEGKKSEE